MNSENPSGIELDSEIIETIYQTALKPERYDDLMDQWRHQIETAVSQLDDAEQEAVGQEDLIRISEGASHFKTAFGILEAMGRDIQQRDLASDRTRGSARFVMNSQGRVVWHNGLAGREFKITAQSTLADLNVHHQGRETVESLLGVLASSEQSSVEDRSLVIAVESHLTGRPVHMTVSNSRRSHGERTLLFQQAGALWRDEIGTMMAGGFGLSPAEVDIVASLVDGKDVSEIAELRQRTVATVRTQLKSVLKKSATRSQNELVRLCLSLSMHQPKSNAIKSYLSSGSVHRLQLKNGSELAYHFYGPENGRPALFIHGMLDGIQCTEAIEKLLFENNIRLIGMERPHFAGSDSYDGPVAKILHYVAECAGELIDHLDFKKKIVVVGHMSGALYAFATAAHRPDAVQAIVNISGGVPIVSSQQMKAMSLRQRLMAYTARYTPSALPFMLRAGIKQLDTGGDRNFMMALYRDSIPDQTACADPEIFDVVSNGYHFSVMQGHKAFEADSYHVVRDWSWLIAKSSCPIFLVHGHHDPVVKWNSVQKFAERLGERASLFGSADCGQLIYYRNPERVFAALEQAFSSNVQNIGAPIAASQTPGQMSIAATP